MNRVYRSKDQRYYVSIATDEGKTTELGPFDIVVAANGLSYRGKKGSESSFLCSSIRNSIAVIGDARWYKTLWWNLFGFLRIKKGAAIAMMDGVELGRRLIDGKPLDKYAASWVEQQQQRRKMIMVSLRIALILLVIFSFLHHR